MVKRLEPRTVTVALGKAKLQGRTIRSRVHSHCPLSSVVLGQNSIPIMPNKVVETPYPPIDADPHASRVIGYFRPSDYAAWAGTTAAFPAALYAWGMKFSQLVASLRFDKAYRDGRPHQISYENHSQARRLLGLYRWVLACLPTV